MIKFKNKTTRNEKAAEIEIWFTIWTLQLSRPCEMDKIDGRALNSSTPGASQVFKISITTEMNN